VWGSGWVDQLKRATLGLGGFVKHGMGAVVDLATADLPGSSDQFNKMMSGLGNFLGGTKGSLGWGGDAIAWTMQKDQELYSHYVSRPIATALTAGSLADSQRWQKQTGDNGFSVMFDPDTWKKAWGIAKHRSPGQALVLSGAHDIMDSNEVNDFQRGFWFNLLSGSTDAVISMEYDPMGKLSKLGVTRTGIQRTTKALPAHLSEMGHSPEIDRAITAADEAPLTHVPNPTGDVPTPPTVVPGEVVGPGAGQPLTDYVSAPKSPIRKTLEWADSKVDKLGDPALAAKAIAKHPMLRDNAKGGLIATMLANSNWGEKELLMKVALGDPEAYFTLAGRRDVLGSEIAGKRADLAALQKSADDMREDLIKSELPTDAAPGIPSAVGKAVNPERIGTLQAEVDALEKRESWINDVIGKASKPGDAGIRSTLIDSVPKGGIYGPLAKATADMRYALDRASQRGGLSEQWHYYNTYNTPVRILATTASRTAGAASHLFVDKRPGAYLDVNDPQGWQNLDYMLRRVKGFSPDHRNTLVGQYMGATSEGAKLQIANEAEKRAIQHIAERNGLSPEDIDPIINQFMSQRQAAKAVLKDKAYSGTLDDAGRRIDFVDEENIPTSILPLLKTQLADKLPLANIDTIEQAIARHKWSIRAMNRFTSPRTFSADDVNPGLMGKAFKAKDIATDASDVLSSWWKTGALLRLGYTIKMLSDDELAYMAKLGAMAQLHNAAAGGKNFIINRARNLQANARAVKSGDLKSEYEDIRPKQMLGEKDVEIPLRSGGSATAEGMYGGEHADLWRGLSSEGRDLLMQSEDALLGKMRRSMAQGHFKPGAAGHMEAWRDALNNQLGQDAMAQRLLAGDSEDAVVRWLKADPAGRAYAHDLPFRSADPQRWVHNIAAMVDHYAPTPEIRQAALDKAVKVKDLRETSKLLGNAPEVHGGLLEHNMGKGPAAQAMSDFRDGFFKHFSQMPTDVLVRHPLTQALYQTRLKDLVQRWDSAGGTVDNATMRAFENQARAHAVKEGKKVVFDLSQHSNAAHLFRFIAPFYAPWEATLKRWGRLAYGNPSILFRGNRMWQSFNHIAGTELQDENGNPIHGFTGLSADKQLITFRLPKGIADAIPGANVLNNEQIPKSALNVTLMGDPWWLPGFGPFAQIPTSELVKDKPNLYQHLKFLLPYGPQSTKDLLLPNTLKRFNQYNNEDDASYGTTKIRIWQTRYTDWIQNGRKGPAPDPRDPDIAKDAQRLHGLQAAVSALLPVPVRFNSPYKFYIDKYHQMLSDPNTSKQYQANLAKYEAVQQAAGPLARIPKEPFGPMSARDAFISKYPDFFLFADSVSKNNAGVPASIDALKASKKYSALVNEHPDLAPVILGSAAQTGGAFDPAVYSYQFTQKLGDSGDHYRDKQSPTEFAHQALTEQGWNQYTQVMNILRADLGERGLRSFTQNGAEDLAQAKDAIIGKLAEQNPDWFAEFNSYSSAKLVGTINGLQEIAKNPALRSRGDIVSLNHYLAARDLFERVLASRKAAGGAGSLQAQANQDLLMQWSALRDSIAEADTVFQQNIFDRYLSQDIDLQAVHA
jgi:hypothetical protein